RRRPRQGAVLLHEVHRHGRGARGRDGRDPRRGSRQEDRRGRRHPDRRADRHQRRTEGPGPVPGRGPRVTPPRGSAPVDPRTGAAGRGGTADPPIADLTTMHVGGPPRGRVSATTEAELVEAVREVDAAGEPLLVVGGGSNLLVADEGFPGTVVHVRTSGIEVPHDSACGGVTATVAAGEVWDDVV